MVKNTAYNALQEYLAVSRQWNGKPGDKPITVTQGIRSLGEIMRNSALPQSLRTKASMLQHDIILGNRSPLEETAQIVEIAHG